MGQLVRFDGRGGLLRGREMLRNTDSIVTGIFTRAWPMARHSPQRTIEVRQLNDEEHAALKRIAPTLWSHIPDSGGCIPNRIHMSVVMHPQTNTPALHLMGIYDEMLQMQLQAERN